MSIRAIIVDDEPLGREGLRLHLRGQSDVEIIGEATNGEEAIELIRSLEPDLAFLDVQMPGLDGFEVLAELGEEAPPGIVFVTAHDEFAVKAFDAYAIDYVLKPVDPDRLAKAVQRVRQSLGKTDGGAPAGGIDDRLRSLLGEVRPRRRHLQRMAVRVGSRIAFVEVANIDWIGAEGNYARLHVGGDSHLVRETMSSLEERLDPDRFLRIHRSTIVNIERIKELEPLYQGDFLVILKNGSRLPSSRAYRDRLRGFIEG